MLKIVQYMKNIEQGYSHLLKLEPFTLQIDEDMLDNDISKLKSMLSISKNKYNKTNIKYIITNLEKLKEKLDNGTIEVCHSVNDNKLTLYPVDLLCVDSYKVNASDYITLHDERLVVMKLEDVIDIMSFEYIYRDLGYEHDNIEDVLSNSGIAGIVDTKVMTDFFEEEDLHPYELGKGSRIDDSPYISYETKTIKNYFGTNSFKYKGSQYYEVLFDNAKTIISIIASEVIKNCYHQGVEAKLVMLGETSFAFLVGNADDIDINKLTEEISIRFFGRTFRVSPKTQIY